MKFKLQFGDVRSIEPC